MSSNSLSMQVRPLWTIGGATAWLRKDPDAVMRYIEDGRLEWAWDIRAAGAVRRETRIWFQSLEAFKECNLRTTFPVQAARRSVTCLTLEKVINEVIGHHRSLLRGTDVQNILNCDRRLVSKHLAAGDLVAVSLASGKTGSVGNLSPIILRESMVNFLYRRRILE